MSKHFFTRIPAAFIICAVLCLASFFAGARMADTRNNRVNNFLVESNDFKRELIEAHEAYYVACESFLDQLDDRYDWVDAYDPEAYYIAVERLDALYKQEL